MPPFGNSWFGVLDDFENPVAVIRLSWIMANEAEDARLERDRRREEIEYGGLLINPQVYFALKKGEEQTINTGSMQIVYDTSDYNRRLHLAIAGNPEVHDPRQDVADRVRAKRDELDQANASSDPRIHTMPPTRPAPMSEERWDPDGDILEIERLQPRK